LEKFAPEPEVALAQSSQVFLCGNFADGGRSCDARGDGRLKFSALNFNFWLLRTAKVSG
jgi:hypothetical protein